MASRKELTNGKYIDDQMGNGVPEGGTTGQVLIKFSNADYDIEWIDSNKIVQPSYKVYTALLTQTGNAAPVAVVLENTIGSIVWTRNSPGSYTGTLNNSFPQNKTFITYTHDGINGNTGYSGAVRINNNEVELSFNDGIQNPGQYIDIGQNAIESIEIRVYN